jgi:hypothetical protein
VVCCGTIAREDRPFLSLVTADFEHSWTTVLPAFSIPAQRPSSPFLLLVCALRYVVFLISVSIGLHFWKVIARSYWSIRLGDLELDCKSDVLLKTGMHGAERIVRYRLECLVINMKM